MCEVDGCDRKTDCYHPLLDIKYKEKLRSTVTKRKCENCGTECLFLDEDQCEICIGATEYPKFCEPCQNEYIARCIN